MPRAKTPPPAAIESDEQLTVRRIAEKARICRAKMKVMLDAKKVYKDALADYKEALADEHFLVDSETVEFPLFAPAQASPADRDLTDACNAAEAADPSRAPEDLDAEEWPEDEAEELQTDTQI